MRGIVRFFSYFAGVALPAALFCQQAATRATPILMPTGIVRGQLASIHGSASGGTAEVQRDDGKFYDCSYDSHTLFERNRWPIHADDLNVGESVEVLSDQRPGTKSCYVRVMSVVYRLPPPARRKTKIAPLDDSEEAASPVKPTRVMQGNLHYGGVVTQYGGSSLTLRTKAGELILHLRPDTQFSSSGIRIDAPDSLINQHVYVRAARSIYGGVDAYQVMWGQIVNVR